MAYKGTILCVDDEPGILRVLRAQLESFLGGDHEILLAESGEDAMKMLEGFQEGNKVLEMVIADHKMPGIQGAQLLEWISKRFPETIRIMLTGQAGLEDAIYAINHAGLHQYVEKPWNDDDLKLVVEDRLDEFHLGQGNKKFVRELQRKNLMLEQKNRELSESQRALIQSEKLAMIGKLAGGIFHEINNRLNILVPCAQLARELKMREPDFKEYVDEITDLHFLLKDMMGEWIHFARGESVAVPVGLHNLPEIIEEALKIFQWSKHFRNIRIVTDFSRGVPFVVCQRSRIKQCVLNLVQNAMEVLPEKGGELHISVKKQDKAALIEIRDNGPGIPPDLMKRLWNPFVTTKDERNLGLGLYIVKRIVEAHEGRVDCMSEMGKGAIFQVTLPLRSLS